MKKHLLLILIVVTIGTGCRSSQFGHVKSKGLFANLEFEEATGYVYELGADGKTNRIEYWNIQGLKSDTQKSLETINKALDKIPQKP